MSRLLNALCSCSSALRRTVHPISEDLRADINWWQYFLSQYDGVSVIPSDLTVSNPELFATDASHRLRCGLFRQVFSQRVSGFNSYPRKAH